MSTNPTSNKQASDTNIHYVQPSAVHNNFYYLSGLSIMILNRMRHAWQGYKSARGFPSSEIERAINYDWGVVKRWMDYFELYEQGGADFSNRNVLELGPGADLGVGLFCLAGGANSYHSLDVHELVSSAPQELYDFQFQFLEKAGYDKSRIEGLKKQLNLWQQKQPDQLNYLVRNDFSLDIFKDKKIDLVVSNSAFQQFDDPAQTIAQLSQIVQPGGKFIALIDLQTHTRWIRQNDPLNIYRYSDSIYKLLTFRGSPNRIRPSLYQSILEKHGWENVKVFPRIKLKEDYVKQVGPTLNDQFAKNIKDIEDLTVVICATKK